MINPKVISRIIANTDMKTKLRLAKVVPKLGKADDITKCMLCPNMCLYVCPVFDAERRLTVSPSVKARLAYFSGNAFDAIYHCLPCDACKNACPMDISVNDILRDMRSGEVALKAAEKFEREVYKKAKKIEERDGSVLYFPGCRTFESGLFDVTVEVLEKLNLDFALTDAICCGMPYYELGLYDRFRAKIDELKRIASKYEGVVSNCPHCVWIMRENGIKAAHILSVLNPVKLGGDGDTPRDVSYHDPCVLARKLDIVNEPRKLLEDMGFELHEPLFSKKDTHCCGYGGVYRFIAPDYAERVAERRREHFEYEVITACPSCKLALKAKDIVELVGERL